VEVLHALQEIDILQIAQKTLLQPPFFWISAAHFLLGHLLTSLEEIYYLNSDSEPTEASQQVMPWWYGF